LPDARAQAQMREALGLLEARKQQAEEHLALRRKASGEGTNLLAVMARIDRLKAELQSAMSSRRSPSEVIKAPCPSCSLSP
jgi:hypothetical protein